MAYISTNQVLDVDIDAIRLAGSLANDDPIVALTNAAGGNSGVQATSGNRAIIATNQAAGKAGAVFDGGNDNYNFGNIFAGLSQFSMYLLFKCPATFSPGWWTTSAGEIDGVSTTQIIFSGTYYEGLGSTARPAIGTNPFNTSRYDLLTITSKANEYKIYVNGTLIFTTTTNTVGFATNFIFGRTERIDWFAGSLLRMMSYSTAHSAAEVSSQKTQFANDYQLAHLGYSAPTSGEKVYFQII